MDSQTKHNLPNQSFFQGRLGDLQELVNKVNLGRQIIAISGHPGIGKTTLALRFAHILVEKVRYYSVVWATAKPDKILVSGGTAISPYLRTKDTRESNIRNKIWANSLPVLYRLILRVSEHPNYHALNFDNLEQWDSYKLQREVTDWLRIRPVFIVVDDVDSWSDWSLLYNFAEKIGHPSTILITVRRKPIYNQLNAVDIHSLSPIPLDVMEKILQFFSNSIGFSMSRDEKKETLRFADGNPLFLRLATAALFKARRNSMNSVSYANVFRFGNKETSLNKIYLDLYKNLENNERRVLKTIAILDKEFSLNRPTLDQISEVSGVQSWKLSESIEELRRSALIDLRNDDMNPLDCHELTKNYALQIEPNLTKELRIKAIQILSAPN